MSHIRHLRIARALMALVCGTGLCSIISCRVNRDGPNGKDEPIPSLAADCPSAPSSLVATAAERDQLFEFLTANAWANSDEFLRLQRGGSFRRQAHGVDFIAQAEEGTWSLIAHDARSGIVFLGDLGMWPVTRADDGRLLFDFVYFDGGSPITYSTDEARRTASDLLPGHLPMQLRPLLNVCWQKANSLNLNREPEFVAFGPGGHFRATFRNGSCVQDGTFGFDASEKEAKLSLLGDQSCAVDSQDPAACACIPC